jgi:hypothetical protein
VSEQPDEREVQVAEQLDSERDPNNVDDHGSGHHHRGDTDAEPLVKIQHPRRQSYNEQVDREEPDRLRDQGGPVTKRVTETERLLEHERDDEPGPDEHHGRLHESFDAAPNERTRGLTLAASRLDGNEVGETSDEEEERHHLEEPGQDPHPRDRLESAFAGDVASVVEDDRHEPVAEDDDSDAERAQEVDVTISGIGGRGRKVLQRWACCRCS